jgi:type II secretory pathway pseudopilin PulG
MLITLMLALALITIGLLTVLPEIGQQIRRDREEEMRHRGTAYMRAIQHFYKKFGRYPSRIEELENTNNLRFIRKRYKDPINRDPSTGQEKDFKLLHQTDITLNNGPVLGQIPGQSLPGQGGLPGQSGLGQGSFGGAQGGLGGLQGGLGGLGAQPGGLQQPGNSAAQTPAGGDSGNASSGDASDTGGNSNSAGSSPSSSNANSNSGSGFNGPTFGGGPILGVASASKAKSIRVFYEKNHYNDWLFIYVPQADRGGLLTGPVSLNGPTGNFGGVAPGVAGGLPGQVQGLSPNTSQPQNLPQQPVQSPGQTPPEE